MIAEATKAMKKMNVDLHFNARVSEVKKDCVMIGAEHPIPSSITIWTTGVKAPEVLSNIDGIKTNKGNQIVVNAQLQSVSDDCIYAIGDCAEFVANGKKLAPRAQVAQQQVIYLAKSFVKRFQHESPSDFVFKDQGTFVSLGDNSSVGTVLGTVLGAFNMHGFIAKMGYVSLYRMHQLELLSPYKTIILLLKDLLTRALGPKLKLH